MSFHRSYPGSMASSRLPGKPLVDIGGKPMIQHVYERAVQSKADEVLIVTDAVDIQEPLLALARYGDDSCRASVGYVTAR